jgi:hypothetical protein
VLDLVGIFIKLDQTQNGMQCRDWINLARIDARGGLFSVGKLTF